MRRGLISAAAGALLLCGCGQAGKGAATAQAAPAGGTPCPIIGAADVSAAYGARLADTPANSLPQAQSCEFRGAGPTVVRLQLVPARYYEEHGGQGFRTVPGLGDKASISFELGAWRAMAAKGDKAVAVTAEGPAAKPENTLAILKAALAML